VWNCVDRAADRAMRYVGSVLGWARKGKGGEDHAEQGAVGWISFVGDIVNRVAEIATSPILTGGLSPAYSVHQPSPANSRNSCNNASI